jgi:dUTPase
MPDTSAAPDASAAAAAIRLDHVTLKRGDRIAQLVFARFEAPAIEESGKLSMTERGAGGFGSTGV